MPEFIFTMRNLTKVHPPDKEVLKDVTLAFYPGAKIGVLGANGAGKSTLLRIMAGVDKDYEGEAIPMPNMRVGFLPQEPHLDPEKDVRGNVEEGVGETMALLTRFNEISDKFAEPMDDDEMAKLLEETGLSEIEVERGGVRVGGGGWRRRGEKRPGDQHGHQQQDEGESVQQVERRHEGMSRISGGKASRSCFIEAARSAGITRIRPFACTTIRSWTPFNTTVSRSDQTMLSFESCSEALPTTTFPCGSLGRTRVSACQVPMSSQAKAPLTTATDELRSRTPTSIEIGVTASKNRPT